MYNTLKVNLLPDEKQTDALIDTFVKFNEACNFVARLAFERKLYNMIQGPCHGKTQYGEREVKVPITTGKYR